MFAKRSVPIHTKWVVITGAPSSGKTTLISMLAEQGFEVFHDVARQVIEEMARINVAVDEEVKQRAILDEQIRQYEHLPVDRLVVHDFGLPDNLAFQRLHGVHLPLTVELAHLIRYRAVFVLEPLPIVIDGVRQLDEELQDALFSEIVKTYSTLGYSPTLIGVGDVHTRLKQVLAHLEALE